MPARPEDSLERTRVVKAPDDRSPEVTLVPFAEAYRDGRAFRSRSGPRSAGRLFPLVASLVGYDRSRLRSDVVAGTTVAALALPASMAYAELAGLPVTAGLYSLLLPVVAYALLGSARWLVVGPEGTIALLVASGLAPLAAAGSPEYTALAATLALVVGLVFLAARLLRLGWVADYFSQAVLVGYISGVAVLIILGQLGKLLGMSSDRSNAVVGVVDMVSRIGEANPATVIVGIVSLALMFGLALWFPRWPAALIVVLLGIAVSWALDLAGDGVRVTGPVPAGLPSIEMPVLGGGQALTLGGVAISIFLVGFADSILTARSFAAKRNETVDADQELVAFAASNLAAGLSHGMPVGTSGSRTAVNLDMRAGSQVSGIVSAAVIAVILLFLTDPIQYLPAAVLGAVIIVASLKLIDPDQWRALAAGSRTELMIAAVTTFAVINIGVLFALVVAVLLSILDVIRRAAAPADAVLGWSKTSDRYADVTAVADAEVTPGTVVYRFSDRLFFANVHRFKRRVWAAADAAPKPTWHVVLDLEGVPDIDSTAAGALRELEEGLTSRNITLDLARASSSLTESLDRFGLADVIGPSHLHATVSAAVEVATARPAGATGGTGQAAGSG